MGRGCVQRRYEFCADLDAILRIGEGLRDFWEGLRKQARRVGNEVTAEITSARGGLVLRG